MGLTWMAEAEAVRAICISAHCNREEGVDYQGTKSLNPQLPIPSFPVHVDVPVFHLEIAFRYELP